MSLKTNKSFSKRLRLTKNGKLLGRKPGKNHFNAKASRSKQLAGKRWSPFVLSNQNLGKYLPYGGN